MEMEVDERKKRQFVSWTEEEDNILREKYRTYGERWTAIASFLDNKTSRQCKRRFSTYLSADFKKGSWSAAEDELLLEAHKEYGNRWTEIAKVVQGRTDNAVKNRFHALQNKQAKQKENIQQITFMDNNVQNLAGEKHNDIRSTENCKRMRFTGTSSATSKETTDQLLHSGRVTSILHPRKVLCSLSQNNLLDIVCYRSSPSSYKSIGLATNSVEQGSKLYSHFFKREDPKVCALAQQAEHQKALVERRIIQESKHELEHIIKVIHGAANYAIPDTGGITGDLDCHSSCQDMHSSPTNDSQTSISLSLPPSNDVNSNKQQASLERLCMTSMPKLQESCDILSQINMGSKLSQNLKAVHNQELFKTPAQILQNSQTNSSSFEEDQHVSPASDDENYFACISPVGETCPLSLPDAEYCTPTRVTPTFQTFSNGIFSPKFSESEKHFLMNLLPTTSESPSENYSLPCKRGSPACRTSLSTRL